MLNFKNSNKNYLNNPFPHIVVDDFLDKGMVEKLNLSLENSDTLFHHHGWNGKRSSIQFGSSQYKKLIKQNDVMSIFHEAITSHNTLKQIYNLFEKDFHVFGLKDKYVKIDNLNYNNKKFDFVINSGLLKKIIIKFFYNPILRKLKIRRFIRIFFSLFTKSTLYPGISISKSIGGYTEGTHTDSRHKLFVGLIYLDALEKGGELNILSNKNNISLEASQQYLEKQDEKIIKQIKPEPGKLILFLNTNNAYHSVEGFKGVRRFIYFSFAINNTESLFKTNYTVKLSDVSSSGKI